MKLVQSTFLSEGMLCKTAGKMTDSADPDQTAPLLQKEQSDLDMHCLHRHVCSVHRNFILTFFGDACTSKTI